MFFFLSHTTEAVSLPDQDEVDDYLPAYRNTNRHLDPDDPMFVNPLCPTADFSEVRYQQQLGFDKAMTVLPAAMDKFASKFGRKYGLIEAYQTEDADALKGVKNIGVIDRSMGIGYIGPVCADVRAALGTHAPGKSASSFLAGLAGRDIHIRTIGKVFDFLLNGEEAKETVWIDTDTERAMTLREVQPC